MNLQPFLQTGAGLRHQFGGFRSQRVVPLAAGEERQDRIALRHCKRTALGDDERVGERFRQIGKQQRHLGGGFQVMVRRQFAAVLLEDFSPLRDAQKHIVGFVILRFGEIGFVGGDQRNVPFVCHIEQGALDGPVITAMALQLDVESVAVEVLQCGGDFGGKVRLTVRKRPIERTGRAAGQDDQAVRMGAHLRKRDMGAAFLRPFHMGETRQFRQVVVAGLVHRQKDQRRVGAHGGLRRSVRRRIVGFTQHDFQLAADDGLKAGGDRLLAEFQRPEQIRPVRHGYGGLFVGCYARHDVLDRQRAFQQRKSGMNVQMHEWHRRVAAIFARECLVHVVAFGHGRCWNRKVGTALPWDADTSTARRMSCLWMTHSAHLYLATLNRHRAVHLRGERVVVRGDQSRQPCRTHKVGQRIENER